jgi:hypothetical protein
VNPTLDGADVFGTACHVVHEPSALALQRDSFFGLNGVMALNGGSRGRMFRISGVFVGPDIDTIVASEAFLLSYADGLIHTFVDTQGRSWPNVIFPGQYQPSPEGPKFTDFGFCLPFSCTLEGLS